MENKPVYSVDDILAELAEGKQRRRNGTPTPPVPPAAEQPPTPPPAAEDPPPAVITHLPPDIGSGSIKPARTPEVAEKLVRMSFPHRKKQEEPKEEEPVRLAEEPAAEPPQPIAAADPTPQPEPEPRPAIRREEAATRIISLVPSGSEEKDPPPDEDDDSDMGQQLQLSDYMEMPPLPQEEEPVDADALEDELQKVRREKVVEFQKKKEGHFPNFRLSGDEEEDNDPTEEPETPDEEVELEDYSSYAETEAVQNELSYRRRTGWIGCVLTLALELVLAGLALIARFTGAPPMETYLYIGLHAFLLAFMMLVNHQTVGGGLFSLFRMQADGDSAAALASAAALIHTLVQFFRPDDVSSGLLELLAPAAGLSLLLTALGRQARVLRVCANFRFVSYPGDKFEAKRIEDLRAAEEIGRPAVALGEPQVAYFKPADFLSHFLDNSYAPDGSEKVLRLFMPLLTLAAALLGVGYGFASANWWMALSVFVSTLCLSAPAAMFAVHFPLLRASKKALSRGGMISGWNAVKAFGRLHGVVVDAADLFPSESVLLHGIKTFAGARIDEAILDAAAVSIKAGGPLAGVFRRVIEDKVDILPAVDSLVYEQDMGLSGWVAGRRVLVGNRRLLENHGVDVPSRDYELRYTRGGRQLVYLSTAGELSAMFVISYKADEGIVQALHSLEKAHITLLVRTCDPNVTEELICSTLDIDEYYVELMGNAAGRVYTGLLDEEESETPAVLASNGRIEGIAAALSGCHRLRIGAGLGFAVQIAAAGLGFALSAVLAFHNHMVFPTVYTLVYLLISAGLSWLLPGVKRS